MDRDIDRVDTYVVNSMEHNTKPWSELGDKSRDYIRLARAEGSNLIVWASVGDGVWFNTHDPWWSNIGDTRNAVIRITPLDRKPQGRADVMTVPRVDPDYSPSVPVNEGTYLVQVYVRHGYYEYPVNNMDRALAHAEAIMSGGTYRRSTEDGDVEVHTAYKVKVKGPGLKSEYLDTFKRT